MTGPVPAGVLTFVYTDIEGSTKLLRDLGEAYDELIEVYRRLARAAWERHAGTELSTEGDGFVVAFQDAGRALAATVSVQREFASAPWPTTQPVRVRVGIHTGFARLGASGYSGLALHQAARVVGAAHGDQIFLTAETVGSIRTEPVDIEIAPLGRFRVRDFDDPVELFTVRGPGLPTCDAAPRVPPAEHHNIVRPTTTLVDRVDECQRLVHDIARRRLVTLLGPGGVGKTRLAIEVGLEAADEWRDGVWFVDLAPVGRPDLVDAAVADTLGASASAGSGPRDRIVAHLADRRALLVLDNCEHLSPAPAELVEAVLAGCREVGVLATSRSPIGLRSERVHRIGPLAVGAGSPGGPAIELFAARSGGFDPETRPDVVDLCRELDGLPLAIELAAARAHSVPPRELVARLRRFPTSLETIDPGLPERHRSLARVLDWSIERLSAGQRSVLSRLAVCVGGFDLETALAVCAAPALDDGDVVEHLWSLVDSSLVEIDPAAGETRYRLLTTVRKHVEACTDQTELDEAWQQLAGHLRRVLDPDGEIDRGWIVRMAIEIDNVRAVVEHPSTPVANAQALAWAVGKYHDLTDRFRVGIDELSRWESLLAAETPERVAMLTMLADLHLRLGDLSGASDAIARATQLSRTCPPPDWDAAGPVRARADLALRLGDIAGAIEGVETELRNPHPRRAEARLWDTLGIARGAAGDFAGAVAAFESELVAATTSASEAFLATTHGNLAEAKLQLDDRRGAARHQLISLELARAQRQPVNIAFSMMIAARLIAADDRYADVVRLQTVADGVLADAGFELYAEDRDVRAELLADAASALGPEEFERIEAEARSFDPDATAELAASVFISMQSPVGKARH